MWRPFYERDAVREVLSSLGRNGVIHTVTQPEVP